MKVAIVTGSAGLIGSQAVRFLAEKNEFDLIIGIDNYLRSYFFGADGSVEKNNERLKDEVPNYKHIELDIRNYGLLDICFDRYSSDIELIIHAAAQPSHDWAKKQPLIDFHINASGTINLLEVTRKYCPKAVFIFTSTNKVYGDTPNILPLVEYETRFDLPETPINIGESDFMIDWEGIDELMSIDQSVHSVFGASKVAADIMVQEYGKYFGLYTGVFRGGCLTGPSHAGAELHGFLSYLMKCTYFKKPYTIFGYSGKQVRDNIHSWDLINMFWHYYKNPKHGEVYNAGGSRHCNCSVLEAIDLCEITTGNKLSYNIDDTPRKGDHKWYISDVRKFKGDYPEWDYTFILPEIINDIFKHIQKNEKSKTNSI